MINVAVVGLGFMGVTHIKAYRTLPNVRIAAICDAARLPVDGDLSNSIGNIGAVEPLKLDMSQVKATKHYQDLLGDSSIDLIDICAPTPAHPKLAIAALQAGKHVVCEKPMARTAALAREIELAAKTAKGYFMPAMCIRFWPEYAWVKKAIDEGKFGKVLAARFRRVGEPPAWGHDHFLDGSKSGGAILDLHIHDTDFVQYCFGRPKSVFSTGMTRYSGAIDHIVTQYQVECGAVVSAEGSWLMSSGHGFNMTFTVNFEKATVDYDMSRRRKVLRLFREGRKPRTVEMDSEDGYVSELAHFIECIGAGKPPSVVTAADGAEAVEIIEAEEKSIATKQVVMV